MARVFKVKPRKEKRANGIIISPAMEVVVTTKQEASTPFYNGAVELKEAFMRLYGVDIKKGNYSQMDFLIEVIR